MHFNSILAKGDDDWSKIIIGAIAVAIWVLHSLAQVFNKKKESERNSSPPPDYRSPEEIQRQQQEIARRLEEMARKPSPTQARPVPGQPRPAQRKSQKLPKPPVKIFMPAPQSVAPPQVIAPAAPQPQRPTVVGASAVTLSRFLRPGTLRHQFILTEILQKPVALRPEHLDDL